MRHHAAAPRAPMVSSRILLLLLCLSLSCQTGRSSAEESIAQTPLPPETAGQPATGVNEQPAAGEMISPAPEPTPGEIESRGMPQIQRPMQPGMRPDITKVPGTPAQPSAAPQKFQLPTWPQKFAIEDRQPASFGIVVTQPGQLLVDVQWQGPPLEAALQGPSAQPIVQRGQGQVRLAHQVTQQDVQKGNLWTVRLTLVPNTKGQASGQVTVQHPPVDEAQAEAAVRTRLAQRQSQPDAVQIQAHTQAILQASKKEDARQYQEYLKGTARQADVFLKQNGFQGQVQSRAVPPPRDTAKKFLQLPPGAGQALKEFPPPPPPHIDRLSVTNGQPGARVVIHGSGFTNRVGVVHITPQNTAVNHLAKVVTGPAGPIWTDTLIEVTVPELTGVTHFHASLYVIVDGEPSGAQFSNSVAFLFVPRQQSRVLTMVSPFDRRLASHHTYTQATGGAMTDASVVGNEIHHNRFAATFFNAGDIFFGKDGRDWFFENTALQNGWRVTCVEVIPYDMRSCNPTNTVYGIPPLTGAYVAQSDQTLKLQVRWWFEAFIPGMTYTYLFVIRGPENVPDGVLCHTVSACSAP